MQTNNCAHFLNLFNVYTQNVPLLDGHRDGLNRDTHSQREAEHGDVTSKHWTMLVSP